MLFLGSKCDEPYNGSVGFQVTKPGYEIKEVGYTLFFGGEMENIINRHGDSSLFLIAGCSKRTAVSFGCF